MSKAISIIGLVIVALASSASASAFYINGSILQGPGQGKVTLSVVSHSIGAEFLTVTSLQTFADLYEEGNIADQNGANCLREFIDYIPQDIHCGVLAQDSSVTQGCEYCGVGTGTPYYYYIGGDPEYWGQNPPKCIEYGQGGGGPGDP